MNDYMPDDIQKDDYGNYFYIIGESKSVFASHLDTVSKDYWFVQHEREGNIISTDGKTTLGADDKAGVTIMLWMIKNKVPGLYYFFIGEEVGCIGSGLASKHLDFSDYNKMISFDRKGTSSVITHQTYSRCCSDEFAIELCKQFNGTGLAYKLDDGGLCTDSAEFMEDIPECTKIPVVYYKEHSFDEHQDIVHLAFLADACTKVDWENLPIVRDETVAEYDFGGSEDWENYTGISTGSVDTYNTYNDGNISEGGVFYVNGKKKTRRSGNKNRGRNLRGVGHSRVYFDSDELIDVTDEFIENKSAGVDCNNYDWIMDKILNDTFNEQELESLKECYLDMDVGYDKFFYEYLKEQLSYTGTAGSVHGVEEETEEDFFSENYL